MEIIVLGAGNVETSTSRTSCLLIDGVLALDAGSLSSGLTLDEQKRVRAILITHRHFDHIKDLPMIGLATGLHTTKEVCGLPQTLEFARSHLFDGDIYPRLEQWPSAERPSFRLRPLEALRKEEVAGYQVMPLPLKHGNVEAVGYAVFAGDGRSLFYTGDTGGDLAGCWEHVSPRLLAIEVSMPDGLQERARDSGHLTPGLLERELVRLQEMKGYVPDVLAMHLGVEYEREIKRGLARLAGRLGARITAGRRSLKVSL